MFFEMIARVFEQIAILHAAGTNRFARAAAETQIDMPHCRIAEGHPAFLHGAHDVNPPARRVIFIPRFQIGRTRPKTQATMNAGQRFVFVQETNHGANPQKCV